MSDVFDIDEYFECMDRFNEWNDKSYIHLQREDAEANCFEYDGVMLPGKMRRLERGNSMDNVEICTNKSAIDDGYFIPYEDDDMWQYILSGSSEYAIDALLTYAKSVFPDKTEDIDRCFRKADKIYFQRLEEEYVEGLTAEQKNAYAKYIEESKKKSSEKEDNNLEENLILNNVDEDCTEKVVLPKKKSRKYKDGNDFGVISDYMQYINKGTFVPWEKNPMWDSLMTTGSQYAIKTVVDLAKSKAPRGKKSLIDTAYKEAEKIYSQKIEEEYIAKLTPEQKAEYEKQKKHEEPERFPICDKDGRPKGKCAENVQYLIEKLGFEVKQNMVTRRTEVYHNGEYSIFYSSCLDRFYAMIISEACKLGLNINKSTLVDMLRLITKEYNPFIDYLKSSYDDWDHSEGYIHELFSCFELEGCSEAETEMLFGWFRKWLVQAVVISYNNLSATDVNPQTMLVLASDRQGLGKSTWGEKLVPVQWVSREKHLNPKDKDSRYQCTCAVLTELSEFASSSRYVDLLKAFLVDKVDEMRRPYDARESRFPRITSFYGTVNDPKFLFDSTGNRRFIVVPLADINREKLNSIDMTKVWAEAYHHAMVAKDVDISISVNEAEAISRFNERFREISNIEQALLENFAVAGKEESGTWFKSSDISKLLCRDEATAARDIGKVLVRWVKEKGLLSKTSNGYSVYYLKMVNTEA